MRTRAWEQEIAQNMAMLENPDPVDPANLPGPSSAPSEGTAWADLRAVFSSIENRHMHNPIDHRSKTRN